MHSLGTRPSNREWPGRAYSTMSQRRLRFLLFIAVSVALLTLGCQQPLEVEPETGIEPSFAAGPSGNTTYYVSPTGNDRKSGTSIANAWRTIKEVNGRSFGPGDRILFEGGAVFTGTLSFTSGDKGTAASPVVISSFGTGRAIVDGGTADGFWIYNTAGLEIRNIVVRGAGRTLNTGNGINVYTQLSGGVKLDYIKIDNVEVSGFGKYGIVFGSWNGTTGYKNVSVTNTSTHDNTLAGFSSYAQLPYSHQNFYLARVRSYNNSGKAGLTSPSGSGITLGSVSVGTIERSVAYNNGWLCNASGGPVGIWTYDSDRVLIQFNESYGNKTAGPADGGGFDLDQNTKNSTLQYNYSHDNHGPGLLMAHGPANSNHSGNVIRYNISENDGRKNSTGAITIWGRTISAEIYNNTVYLKPALSGSPKAIYVQNGSVPANDVNGLHVRNNTLYTTGGLSLVEVSKDQLSGGIDIRFQGNTYYAGGSAFKVVWGATTYGALTNWRSGVGQELLNGLAIGAFVNPMLASPGAGGTVGNADNLATLQAYRLLSGSPNIDKALNLKQVFGLVTGSMDFWGGSNLFGLGYDIGAHEYP